MMKVKELIEEFQKCDLEKNIEIQLFDYEGDFYASTYSFDFDEEQMAIQIDFMY